MPRFLTCLLALGAISVPVLTHTASPAIGQAQRTAAATDTTDKNMQDYRNDLLMKRADLLAKNITLSASEAAKFWPLFEKYQAEQGAIVDAQVKGTENYAANYGRLDDGQALAYVNALLSSDESMAALRRKYLPEFQKVVSPTTAARAIQIDRRVSLLAQLELSSQIPLVR